MVKVIKICNVTSNMKQPKITFVTSKMEQMKYMGAILIEEGAQVCLHLYPHLSEIYNIP